MVICSEALTNVQFWPLQRVPRLILRGVLAKGPVVFNPRPIFCYKSDKMTINFYVSFRSKELISLHIVLLSSYQSVYLYRNT